MNDLKDFSIFLADKIVSFIGSWRFIIIQSSLLVLWIILNVMGILTWDPYPFILLNLCLSFQAAYATPLILMSSNRQGERDHEQLTQVLHIDKEDHIIIEDLKKILTEVQKDVKLSKKAQLQRKELKKDHEHLKKELASIKELLKNYSR
jgi:uncharacterized membrane protein